METDEVDGARSSNSSAYLEHSETELEGEFLGNMRQPCLTEDKNVRSNKFCVECNEYLCKNCIRAHSKFSSTRYHRLAENEESSPTTRTRANAGTCFYHADKYLDHFCEIHDEFCCPFCLNTKHRACKAKATITEVSSKLTEEEINDVEEKTGTVLDKIQEVKARRTQDLDMLVVKKQEAMNDIDSVACDLKTVFERLHQNHIESLERKCVKLRRKLENDLKTCNEMEGSLKKIVRLMKCESKVSKFVHMKQLLRQLDVVNATSNAMVDDVPEKSIELKRSTICTTILSQPNLLVDFAGDLRLYNSNANGKVVNRCALNQLGTTKDCRFTCVYQNPSNLIFPLDKSISVYDTMTTKMRQINTPEQISAIAIYKGAFFIALQNKGLVVTLDENDILKTILTTVEPCVGISKSSTSSRIYVTVASSQSGQLREYTDAGTLENVLKTNYNGENIFTGGIGEVKICKKENNIYVTDTKTGIVIVSAGAFKVLKIISNMESP